MTGHQHKVINGITSTNKCAGCGELKNDEFFLVPASEYGMGHGRVTVCRPCYDGPLEDISHEEALEEHQGKVSDLKDEFDL